MSSKQNHIYIKEHFLGNFSAYIVAFVKQFVNNIANQWTSTAKPHAFVAIPDNVFSSDIMLQVQE